MSETDASSERLDPQGRERPRFIFTYPDDPELAKLTAAFERGDFRSVGIGAKELEKTATDPEVKAAARDLMLRIQPDPLVRWFWLVAVVVFTFLVAWSYSQSP
jgi:hypothetical protein